MRSYQFILLFFCFFLSAPTFPSDFHPQQARTEYFMNGKRKVAIIASEEGYYPDSFSIFTGEEITIFFTNSFESKGCLVIDGKEIFLSSRKGSIAEGKVSFKDPGKYLFYCPSLSYHGEITVLPRYGVEEEAKREIASVIEEENGEGPWIPRDE